MPLLSSFVLSSKKSNEAFISPRVENGIVRFKVTTSPPKEFDDYRKGYKRGVSGIFECASCGSVTTRDYTAQQANEVGLGSVQTAVVCDGPSGRIYVSPEYSQLPSDLPKVDLRGLEVELAPNPRDVWCRNFGLKRASDLFTSRQLIALTTLCDLVVEARQKIREDAILAGMLDDAKGLQSKGLGATAYAEAVSTYLAFVVDRCADFSNSVTRWAPSNQKIMNLFGKQTIPMTWDYPEAA